VIGQEPQGELKYLTPPFVLEILEQQRMILDMHKELLEVAKRVPIQFVEKEGL